MKDKEWSQCCDIVDVKDIDVDGDACFAFSVPTRHFYLNKQDAIKIAKMFGLTAGDEQ